MDITIHNVTAVELEDLHASGSPIQGDQYWRELVIKSKDGELRITLYAEDESSIKVLA